MKTYRGHHIEKQLTGLYSCFIVGRGFFRADTLEGIKKLIRENE